MKKYIYDIDLKAQIAIESILDRIKTLEDVERIIDNMPPAPVEEVKPKGEWIECDLVEYDGHGECIHYPREGLMCSRCRNAFKKELLWKRSYCPNCGAKMEW